MFAMFGGHNELSDDFSTGLEGFPQFQRYKIGGGWVRTFSRNLPSNDMPLYIFSLWGLGYCDEPRRFVATNCEIRKICGVRQHI